MNVLGASRFKSRTYDYNHLSKARRFIEAPKNIRLKLTFSNGEKIEFKIIDLNIFIFINSEENLGYMVPLASTCLTYGSRWWFHCPNCHRRCHKLYLLEYLICHKCAKLTYESTHTSRLEYLGYKIKYLRRKIWNNEYPDINCVFEKSDWVKKPKWMKQSRFNKLRDKLLVLEQEGSQLFRDVVARICK